MTRRELLRAGVLLAGGAVVISSDPVRAFFRQAAAAKVDPLTARRAQMAAAPIQSLKLSDNLTMLSGPGGNVVVLNGRDGKVVVDTFVRGVWGNLKTSLDAIGSTPIKSVIDTHWHFDHADNNADFRKAGAAIVAHENTKKRLSQRHNLLGLVFEPSPPEALPTETFKDKYAIEANGEQVWLGYIQPAHTDTDIYIRFSKANVLHLGDVYFNGFYPFIDASTGGRINGMIAGASMALEIADARTKIVPGHGPLGDRNTLTQYRDVLVTARDRVQKLKASGRTLDQVIAENPMKEFDPTWGKGFMGPKDFIALVYNTL